MKTTETTRVRCQSGITGERSRLRSRYGSRSEWEAYSETYGLASRLGYSEPGDAWDENPLVESSVNPSDFRKATP